MKNNRLTALLLAAVLALPLLAACGSTVSETIDDASITARVKTAFVNEPTLSFVRIDVDTFKGVVTLSGRVKSKNEETKAIALAKSIKGVTDVKSTLQIESNSER
ncbi:MAG TPA: BON domain-containing protein [Vicinamibacterales bacterium]|nr:BON domain-containing protein [Vicinamibacterales bacterium]